MDSNKYSDEAILEEIKMLKTIESELKLKHFGRLKYLGEYYEITT